MAIQKTPAIVIKAFDYRETSKIARFFTRDHGKMSGVLKGIRKDPRKFGSSVDKFTVNDLVYYEYKRSDLHLISHCDLRQYFFQVREDYTRNIAANYAMELVDQVMPTGMANEEIYQLILDYLESLENYRDIHKLVYMLQIKILQLSGFSPHLDACVKTGKQITGRARFSMMLGGLVAPEVKTQESSFMVISGGAIRTILHVEKSTWKQALRLQMSAGIKKELKFLLNNFLIYHLERKIRSAKYL